MIPKDKVRLALDRQIENCKALSSLKVFVKRFWPIVCSQPLQWNWYYELLCEELEKFAWGETRFLTLSVPPRTAKSTIVSVLLPAWKWLHHPSLQILAATHVHNLALRDSVFMRLVVESEDYMELVSTAWEMARDDNQKGYFRNTALGARRSVGATGGITGHGGDWLIVDDPVDVSKGVVKAEELDAAWERFKYLRSTRMNNRKTGQILLIMQRVSPEDPIGRIQASGDERWTHLSFDALYDPEMPFRHPRDPRTEPGELLCPERFTERDFIEIRTDLGEDSFAAQYQQQPVAQKGMIIAGEWINVISPTEAEVRKYDYITISWDLAFKAEETSSDVCGQVWGCTMPEDIMLRRFTLLDMVLEQLDFVATKHAVQRLATKWLNHDFIVIEDKANGPAVIAEYKPHLPKILPFNPNTFGDKPQRLRVVAPIFAQGAVSVVDAPWTAAYIKKLSNAPKIRGWDEVDATTQALIGLTNKLPEWKKLVGGGRKAFCYGGF